MLSQLAGWLIGLFNALIYAASACFCYVLAFFLLSSFCWLSVRDEIKGLVGEFFFPSVCLCVAFRCVHVWVTKERMWSWVFLDERRYGLPDFGTRLVVCFGRPLRGRTGE